MRFCLEITGEMTDADDGRRGESAWCAEACDGALVTPTMLCQSLKNKAGFLRYN